MHLFNRNPDPLPILFNLQQCKYDFFVHLFNRNSDPVPILSVSKSSKYEFSVHLFNRYSDSPLIHSMPNSANTSSYCIFLIVILIHFQSFSIFNSASTSSASCVLNCGSCTAPRQAATSGEACIASYYMDTSV